MRVDTSGVHYPRTIGGSPTLKMSPGPRSTIDRRGLCGWLCLACVVLGLFVFPAAQAASADWPQWGGHDARNLVSDERGLADSFEPGKRDPETRDIDASTTRNVKWVARLGSAAYGNPTVAGGRVFVGTDDRLLATSSRFKRAKGGLVQCLDEATGTLLWQLVIPMRTNVPDDVWFTHQRLGVCSSPAVDGDRAYVVTSAGDIVCLDVHGQANGNDGPFTGEATYMVPPGKDPIELTDKDADIIWRFDPMDELGVRYHDAASCSVLIHGDMLYTGTSNGCDRPHKRILNPDAPSLIVLDKRAGRLVATDNEKIGHRMPHCQWSPPSLGQVNGKTLIFFGGGDGVVYAFEAVAQASDKPVYLKKVWSYDGNPPGFKFRDGKPIPYYEGDKRKPYSTNENDGRFLGPNQIIATPVFYNNRVYVAMGQDPAHGRGRGLLHAIDATQTGDITQSGCVWKYPDIERTLSTVAIADGLLYAADLSGKLHCLDADTGKKHYVFDTGAETWGGPLVADGKVFLGTKQHFWILAAGPEPKVLSKTRLGAPALSTPIAANGVLYVTSQRYLWAVEKKE
ncbi:MAG: PQQ-binding-like beta-propeller repeat protein [Pirellulales bacterium]|nr:PQQ-binding-like beta-propeller repeat protein [Pirellulales bacterium]